jgi:nucleotide-binding universal stress UspA family protein
MVVRFLIPVNFKSYSINALCYCYLLAQKFDAEITLLHCFTPLVSEDPDETNSTHEQINSIEDAQIALEQIKQKANHEHSANHIHIKTCIRKGYPEDKIPLFCREYSPDLVLMGTKCKGETIKELLGSVTLDVIKKVNNPVLAIPKGHDLNLNKLNNVLFLTDFSCCQYTSLHKLVRLIMSYDTILHNVQYYSGGKDKADIKAQKMYDAYCHSTYRNQKMKSKYIFGDDVLVAANEYIQKNKIDLLALTRKKQGLLDKILHPSLTKKFLFNTEIPMLFFHQ